MTFSATLSSAALASAASRLAALIDNRVTVPIIGNAVLRFTAPDGDGKSLLTLAASNMDQSLILRVEAEGQGECTLGAARLAAACARLERGQKVTLSGDDKGSVTIAQGRARWKLPTLPVADYPVAMVEPLDGAPGWDIDSQLLATLIRRVENAAARNDIARPYLCGIHFDLESHALAATDGNMLAVAALGEGAPPKGFKGKSFTLPEQAVRPLIDLAKSCERITIARSEKEASFASAAGGETLRSRLIETDYPVYRRIIPADRANRFEAHAGELAQAIARASVVEGDVRTVGKSKVRINRLRLDFGAEEIAIGSRNATGEEAQDSVAAKRIEGADATLHVKAEYLSAAVDSFGEAATIIFGIEDPTGPILMTRTGDADRTLLRVLMPMR